MSTSSRQSSRVTIVTTIVAALLLAMPLLAAAQATGTIDNAPQEMNAETGEDPTPTSIPPTATATQAVITPTATTAPSPTATAAVETPTPTTTPSPTATATATQDVVTPTATATASPLPNTDTITTKAETTITLQPGEERELPFSYQVTTPRTGTTIHAELRSAAGDPATGWVLRGQAGPGGWIGDGTSVDLTETDTTTPGTAFTVTFAIKAPAEVKEEETVSLFVSSTATTDADDFEAGVASDQSVAILSVLPAESMMISPMMVIDEQGGLTCTAQPGPRAAGHEIVYTCLLQSDLIDALLDIITDDLLGGLLGKIQIVATNGAGWTFQLGIAGQPKSSPLDVTNILNSLIDGVDFEFTLGVKIPLSAGPLESATTTVNIRTCILNLACVNQASATIKTTVGQVYNETSQAQLSCVALDDYTIAIGSDAAFTCSFKALSTGGIDLNSISLGTLPLGWTASMPGISHGGTFDLGTNVLSFPELTHLAANQSATFDLTLDTSCEATSASIVLTPDSSATMEPMLELPLTIDASSAVVAASFTSTGAAPFEAASVTGFSGDQVKNSVELNIDRGACSEDSVTVQINSENGTYFDTQDGGADAIPLGNVSLTNIGIATGDEYITAGEPALSITSPETIVSIAPGVSASNYVMDLGLSLDVPAGTEPGTYSATLVVDLINDGEQP